MEVAGGRDDVEEKRKRLKMRMRVRERKGRRKVSVFG